MLLNDELYSGSSEDASGQYNIRNSYKKQKQKMIITIGTVTLIFKQTCNIIYIAIRKYFLYFVATFMIEYGHFPPISLSSYYSAI